MRPAKIFPIHPAAKREEKKDNTTNRLNFARRKRQKTQDSIMKDTGTAMYTVHMLYSFKNVPLREISGLAKLHTVQHVDRVRQCIFAARNFRQIERKAGCR